MHQVWLDTAMAVEGQGLHMAARFPAKGLNDSPAHGRQSLVLPSLLKSMCGVWDKQQVVTMEVLDDA